MKRIGLVTYAVLVLVIAYLSGDNLLVITIISSGYLLYLMYNFIVQLGKKILMRELMEMLFVLQIVVAPAFYYVYKEYKLVTWEFYFWPMRVPYEDYFAYTIPAALAFITALYIIPKLKHLESSFDFKRLYREENANIGVVLCVLAIFVDLVLKNDQGSFILVLISQFLYLGFLYIYFSFFKFRKLAVGLLLAYIIVGGLVRGVLGDLIWWPLMLFMYILIDFKIPNGLKITGVISIILVMSILQSIKQTYRQNTWRADISEKGKTELSYLSELVSEKTESESFQLVTWEAFYPLIDRMNLGVHVTNVMDYTPRKAEYGNGETIWRGALGALVPRVFWPDKPKAGGHENYKRFAGLSFKTSSMSIGNIGEAYANFGVFGGIVYTFIFALLIMLFYLYCLNTSKKFPTFILWMPFFFINLIAMETDFGMTFNAMLKSLIFFWAIRLVYPKIIK